MSAAMRAGAAPRGGCGWRLRSVCHGVEAPGKPAQSRQEYVYNYQMPRFTSQNWQDAYLT